MLGLYLHVPFCSAICHYCNFNRGLFEAGVKARYVDALVAHIERSCERVTAATIYFGGGTPSLLSPGEIARIIGACRAAFDVAPDAEITMEMNPESADPATLEGYRAAGVNRLSLGVQSFHDDELRRLGRVHDAARARQAVGDVRVAGFDNISLDLMMWLPEQTVAGWEASVASLAELEPEHASLYILELYPNAPLRDEMARGGWSQAPDDDVAAMYLGAFEALERAGYQQYEISNVAKPGRASRHNLLYWTDGDWLAFGCGAHATRDGVRWRIVSQTEEYISRIAAGGDVIAERRVLSPQHRFEEAMFTGLRLNAGVDLAVMGQRYGVDVWRRYGDRLEPCMAAGLVAREGGRLRLTRRGMLLANEVLGIFV